jgi:tripartite motif-containing protein 71
MATSTEPRKDTTPPGDEPDEEDHSGRKLLVFLLWFLVAAAIGLLALLFWLLRPKPAAPSPGEAAGYPIEVVTTIYGYGDQANELLTTPLGVAFGADGNVWIANTGQSRVEEYTADGGFIRQIGADEGPGQLYTPYGISIDPNLDRVYVADFTAQTVQIFTTSGGYVGHLPADDQSMRAFGKAGFAPYDVQVVNGRIVVASYDGLYFFDSQGHVVARWGGTARHKKVYGAPLGMFNFPDSFTSDPATGRIYVTDTMNRRVVALDDQGKWLWVSGRPDEAGEIKGFWQLPRSIQLGPDGNLYVVDTFRPSEQGMGSGHIVVLSPDGQLLSEFGRTGSDDGAFSFPDQLARDPSSDLWAMADRENNRVVIFRLRTPYPAPEKLEAAKYKGMVVRPMGFVSSTPSPEP